jgi:hypothetical protein
VLAEMLERLETEPDFLHLVITSEESLVLEHDLKPRERVRNGACQSFKDRRKHA